MRSSQPIKSIDVTARNQLGHWAGVISAHSLSSWLIPSLVITFFGLFLSCLILIIHCYVLFRISLKHHMLLAFFLLRFLYLYPPWHFQVYQLSFIWHSQRPQEWRRASMTLGSYSVLTDSWCLYVCLQLSVASPLCSSVSCTSMLDILEYYPPTCYLCTCLFMFMRACSLRK